MERFSRLFDESSPPIRLEAQRVFIAFVPSCGQLLLELVQPDPAHMGLTELLRCGTNFYHLGFTTTQWEIAREALDREGFRVFTSFISEPLGGLQCYFLISSAKEMIEVIDLSAASWPVDSSLSF